jgi:hypothetical protein
MIYSGGSVSRIDPIGNRRIRAAVAVLVPGGYWLFGLYGLLSDFGWRVTVIVGIAHLLVFLIGQQVARVFYVPMIFFMCFVAVGLLVIVAAWIGWGSGIYRSFPLAIVGSIAWSIVAWECTAYLSFIRAKNGTLFKYSPIATRADQILVLTVPMIISGIVAGIFATTNTDSIKLSEHLNDFFNVTQIGIACGLFLSFPWFCLPFVSKIWTEKSIYDDKRE